MTTPEEVCSRKRTYPTRRKAKRAARRLHHFGNALGHPYHCSVCKAWHLTTTSADGRAFHRASVRGS